MSADRAALQTELEAEEAQYLRLEAALDACHERQKRLLVELAEINEVEEISK